MKSLATLALALMCLLTAGAASAEKLLPLKTGDVVQIRNQSGRYMAWYKGAWVVTIPDSPPGDRGTWTVVNLQKVGTKTKFNLINKHSKTALDGDNDNSVVLDDTDHTFWQINSTAVKSTDSREGNTSYAIYNSDWKGDYGLYEKKNDVKDVVLRNKNLDRWSFVRTTSD